MSISIQGSIKAYDGQTLTIVAPFCDTARLIHQGVQQVEVRLVDGRTISTEQRKHIYATMSDISLHTGFTVDELKALMKYDFIAKRGCDYFSLSNTDRSTAREFLQFLIEFCIEWEIPTQENLLMRCPEISRYLYACLLHKTCCIYGVCGKWLVQLHHLDRVGLGRDRTEIIHKGMKVLSLCTKHHNEAHSLSVDDFETRYKVYGIKADDQICKVYKLKKE